VAHRADPEVSVAAGNHRLLTNGLRPLPVTDVVQIFHVPMRTYEQFERKVVQIGEGYETFLDREAGDGRDQLKLLEIYRAGRLREYFDAHVRSEQELAHALGCGAVVLDRRLERFLDGVPGRLRARVGGGGGGGGGEADESSDELLGRALASALEVEQSRARLTEIEHLLSTQGAHARACERARDAAVRERDAAVKSLELLRNSHLIRHTKAIRALYYRVRSTR
jgi:hypothetical protein